MTLLTPIALPYYASILRLTLTAHPLVVHWASPARCTCLHPPARQQPARWAPLARHESRQPPGCRQDEWLERPPRDPSQVPWPPGGGREERSEQLWWHPQPRSPPLPHLSRSSSHRSNRKAFAAVPHCTRCTWVEEWHHALQPSPVAHCWRLAQCSRRLSTVLGDATVPHKVQPYTTERRAS